MKMARAVIADRVTKIYKMYSSNRERFKDLFGRKTHAEEFFALKGVSFEADEGDSIGLIGLNGSGKSTLAKIVAGISMPTEGTITLNGEPSLIAISSGLNGQLTGNENIDVKGLMIGLTMEQINDIRREIIEFADIGEFINQPVKTYSSGMKSRLGFAISVNINPDILVVDEALSVGDPTFMQKCLDKMNEFREKGKTIFFVSHSLPQIKSFCSRALWLEYGMMKAYGPVEEVVPMYERFLSRFNKMTKEERDIYCQKIIENQSHLLIRR